MQKHWGFTALRAVLLGFRQVPGRTKAGTYSGQQVHAWLIRAHYPWQPPRRGTPTPTPSLMLLKACVCRLKSKSQEQRALLHDNRYTNVALGQVPWKQSLRQGFGYRWCIQGPLSRETYRRGRERGGRRGRTWARTESSAESNLGLICRGCQSRTCTPDVAPLLPSAH